MFAIPAATPVITPVVAPAVAMLMSAEVQTPPTVAEESVVDKPTHCVAVPVIGATVGNGTTVCTLVTTVVPHMLFTVYVIVAVPSDKPVATPTASIDITAVLLLLQVPPATAFVSVVVAPKHTLGLPAIAGTIGTTNTVSIAVALAGQPKLLVTV